MVDLPGGAGQGYAVEAAAAAMDWVVEHLGWTEIIHTIHPDNVISQRVAQRLGSTNSGPGKLPPPVEDHRVDVWRQTADEWRRNRVKLLRP